MVQLCSDHDFEFSRIDNIPVPNHSFYVYSIDGFLRSLETPRRFVSTLTPQYFFKAPQLAKLLNRDPIAGALCSSLSTLGVHGMGHKCAKPTDYRRKLSL